MRRAVVLAAGCLVATACSGTLSGSWGDREPTGTPLDAKHVVYTRYLRDNRVEVWIASIDGTGKRRLAAGRAPQISPDGRWVVYKGACDSYGDCPRLYLIARGGGARRVLASSGSGPRWSPDSRHLVFSNETGLFRVEIATGRAHEIVRGNVRDWSYSPAGDEIAYSVVRRGRCFYGNYDIYVVKVSGGTPYRLTTDGCSAHPVWGVRGIAFARLIFYRGWGRHEIWLMNADGTERRTITGRTPQRLLGSGITGLTPIAWSEDGRRLLAGLANEFGSVPFAVDPQRGTIRKIGNYGYADWPEGISRDGRYVLVSVGNVASYDGTRVEIVAYDGRRPRVIAHRAGEASWNR